MAKSNVKYRGEGWRGTFFWWLLEVTSVLGFGWNVRLPCYKELQWKKARFVLCLEQVTPKRWGRIGLNVGWSCPWHQSLHSIVRLRKQQLFCLKVGLSYVWADCTADGTWLPLCMNSAMQLLAHVLQMAVCNQVHKAGSCSTGVQAMKSSLPALHHPGCAHSLYEWVNKRWASSDVIFYRNSHSYPNSKAKPK